MNTSLILTVYNESDSIGPLLESIKSQSMPVGEIVIVDGGSTDHTVAIVREFCRRNGDIDMKLLVEPGCNIAEGRNIAIKASRGEVILVSDGGCLLAKRWVEEICGPFHDETTDIVGGTYSALAENYIQRCMAKILIPSDNEFDSTRFIPSSRSIAFRRTCWQAVSGYPENLKIAEDTAFVRSLLARGFSLTISKGARVHWRLRSSVFGFMQQMFRYAQWDCVARIFSATQLRCFVNTILLVNSFVFESIWMLYLASLSYSLLRLRSRFSIRDIQLLPGVLLLRIIEEGVRCLGYSAGYSRALVS